jgi:DNA-binding response OmpR family regulator
MQVLVADNNAQILQQLCDLLEKEGYTTLPAHGGIEALEIYRQTPPDFIFLDIMMPDLSGYDVCREIRKTDSKTPIIFISTKSATVDKVLGLEFGADDYIVKPFDILEVIARIRALTRRCLRQTDPDSQNQFFQFATIKVFPRELRAEREGAVFELSLREIKILRLFLDNAGKIIDRNELLDYCWGAHIMPESRTVDWHIFQLRKKIETDPAHPLLIRTIHGVGYKFELP